MCEEKLLDIKLKKLDRLLELDNLLMKSLENEEMDYISSLMEKKFFIINEIKEIDKRLKEQRDGKNFSEQYRDKFRCIKKRLVRLKEKEEKLLYMAQEKMKAIKNNIFMIEEIFRVKDKYKEIRPKKNIFERIG